MLIYDNNVVKIVKLDLNNIEINLVKEACRYISNGKIVIFPSDTSYGIAVNASNKISIAKIYALKNRSVEKKISCIFSDIAQIEKYTNVSKEQRKILQNNLPGPFTFILENSNENKLPLGESVGVRIPDFEFTRLLSKNLDIPFTATSANMSEKSACYGIDEFLTQIEKSKKKPDLIIDAGILSRNNPSTVVDIRDLKNIKILRKGDIMPSL